MHSYSIRNLSGISSAHSESSNKLSSAMNVQFSCPSHNSPTS